MVSTVARTSDASIPVLLNAHPWNCRRLPDLISSSVPMNRALPGQDHRCFERRMPSTPTKYPFAAATIALTIDSQLRRKHNIPRYTPCHRYHSRAFRAAHAVSLHYPIKQAHPKPSGAACRIPPQGAKWYASQSLSLYLQTRPRMLRASLDDMMHDARGL